MWEHGVPLRYQSPPTVLERVKGYVIVGYSVEFAAQQPDALTAVLLIDTGHHMGGETLTDANPFPTVLVHQQVGQVGVFATTPHQGVRSGAVEAVTSERGLTSPRDGGALPTDEPFGAGSASTLLPLIRHHTRQRTHHPTHRHVQGKQRRRRPRLRPRPGDTCATASRNDLSGSAASVTTGYDNCDSSHCMFLVDRPWLPSGVSQGRSRFLPLASEPFRARARRRR